MIPKIDFIEWEFDKLDSNGELEERVYFDSLDETKGIQISFCQYNVLHCDRNDVLWD